MRGERKKKKPDLCPLLSFFFFFTHRRRRGRRGRRRRGGRARPVAQDDQVGDVVPWSGERERGCGGRGGGVREGVCVAPPGRPHRFFFSLSPSSRSLFFSPLNVMHSNSSGEGGRGGPWVGRSSVPKERTVCEAGRGRGARVKRWVGGATNGAGGAALLLAARAWAADVSTFTPSHHQAR
jgi:hypothetical protein